MTKKLAKLKYLPNNFQIIENGDYVENIVHETAHALEAQRGLEIYVNGASVYSMSAQQYRGPSMSGTFFHTLAAFDAVDSKCPLWTRSVALFHDDLDRRCCVNDQLFAANDLFHSAIATKGTGSRGCRLRCLGGSRSSRTLCFAYRGLLPTSVNAG